MNRLKCYVTVLLLFAFLTLQPRAIGEQTVQYDDESWVVHDSRDRTLTFERRPQRFAACSSFALETLMALGVEPVVRFEVLPVYPPQAEKVPVVARSHGTGPDVEQLIAAYPDAILLHDVFGTFADSVQQTVGAPVILHQLKSVEDVQDNIDMLGELTGKTNEARRILDDIDQTLAWVREQPKPGTAVKVVSLFGTNDAWYAHRSNSFMGDLLEELGAENLAADAEAHDRYRSLAPIDIERLIAQDPDVVFIIPYNDADPKVIEDFMAHPAFKALRAVRNGRAHQLEGPIYTSHAGPRTGQALRTLYGYLYPDRPQPPTADTPTVSP